VMDIAVNVPRETESLPSNIERQIAAKRAGDRKIVRHGGLLCSRCLENAPASATDRYCLECRAAYERERRKIQKDELLRLRALAQSNGANDGQEHEG
jgi:hypothetical protein